MQREHIFLAGLLHDIGKFWQRADKQGTTSSSILSNSTKNNIGLYCPQYKGQYSHKHVLWTAEFLDQNRSFFEGITGKNHFESFFKAAVKHHAPDQNDVFQRVIQKADHYSSGVDRTGHWGQEDAQAENAWDSFKKVRMVSIFENLLHSSQSYDYRLPVSSLELNRSSFPVKKEMSSEGQTDYADLWEKFVKEFQHLKESQGSAFSLGENISNLLYRYACTVPSSTMHLPDVSLYDHLKSTGIFALCLYDYLLANDRLDASFQIKGEEAAVILIGGDLSGIQKYIYDIVSTDAARNLKGRSFYLQILVENVVEVLLQELALPRAAVVYASGGSFFILAPHTEKVTKKIKEVSTMISQILFNEHQTNLSLAIRWEPVTQDQIFKQKINEAWGILSRKIAKSKSQKFLEIIDRNYEYFFEPGDVGGMQVRDFITGEEFTEEEAGFYRDKKFGSTVQVLDGDVGKPVKASTQMQIDLGKRLRQTEFWVTSEYPISAWFKYEFRVGEMPVYNYLLSSQELQKIGHRNPDGVFIRSFDLDHAGYTQKSTYLKGKNNIYGFTFYGGNDFPENPDGSPVTFDQMAEMGQGAQKLGVLRMDVDNLGSIFISGLDEKRRTFSRYSVLSRNLDFFFKGYLNTIWGEHFRDNCSIIYSGGDDLFIVGNWESVFDFSYKIRDEFKSWVCHNPELNISGGISITGGKFPISKGAEFAFEAEALAKEHLANGKEKDALTLFQVPLNWESELPIVQELKDEMEALIIRGDLPRGILQKLLAYAEMARMQKRHGNNHSWRWFMAYDFSRAAKRQGQNARPFYDKIKAAAFTDNWKGVHIPVVNKGASQRTFLDLLEVAARWTELITK